MDLLIQLFKAVEQSIPDVEEEVVVADEIQQTETVDTSRDSGPPIVESKLKMLSSIAQSALTPAVLSRRKLQWESMGFDVSELEYALTIDSERSYKIYRDVEERVRRAIECDRRIGMIEIRGFTLEAAKMRFRIMQLTGLSDIESELDEILSGDVV